MDSSFYELEANTNGLIYNLELYVFIGVLFFEFEASINGLIYNLELYVYIGVLFYEF